jgi:MraZ protein
MFRGGFDHQVDEKGRIIVPARFREFLAPACFVTRGLNRCLFVFPWTKWMEIEQKLNSASITNLNALALQRFFGTGSEAVVDGQGRLMVPASLREYAGIQKDVYILGASNRLEIWAKSRWAEYDEQELSLEGILQNAAAMGISL